MPLPVQQFRPLTVDETNPFLTGEKKGQELFRGFLENAYAPQGLEQDLQKQKLANALSQIELQYAPQTAKATAAYKQAMANYLASPMQYLKGLSDVGKSIVEPYVVNRMTGELERNPNYNPGLVNKNTPLNEQSPNNIADSSGSSEYPRRNIFQDYASALEKKTTDPVMRRNAASAQELLDDINAVDISPLKEYSGPIGKAKAAINAARLGLKLDVPESYRKYDAFINTDKYILMDTVRKTLATSVVPKYVKETIMPLADPTANLWADPEQIQRRWDSFKNWANSHAKKVSSSMKHVPSEIENKSEEKNKEMILSKGNTSPASKILSRTAEFPNFKNAEEMRAWYSSQDPIVQQAYRRHIGAK